MENGRVLVVCGNLFLVVGEVQDLQDRGREEVATGDIETHVSPSRSGVSVISLLIDLCKRAWMAEKTQTCIHYAIPCLGSSREVSREGIPGQYQFRMAQKSYFIRNAVRT